MVDINALKGKLVERGYTYADVAKALDMTKKTFSNRLKTGTFKTYEVDILVEEQILSREESLRIFFAQQVSQTET